MAELLVWPALAAYGLAAIAYAGELHGPGRFGRLGIWGVRLGWLVPRRRRDRAAVHLPQQQQLAVRGEPGADTSDRLFARLALRSRRPPPEAVHQAVDAGERLDLRRGFHSRHASSCVRRPDYT